MIERHQRGRIAAEVREIAPMIAQIGRGVEVTKSRGVKAATADAIPFEMQDAVIAQRVIAGHGPSDAAIERTPHAAAGRTDQQGVLVGGTDYDGRKPPRQARSVGGPTASGDI